MKRSPLALNAARTALLLVLVFTFIPANSAEAADGNWYRGSIHAHSFWSDGNDFPEMAADRYKKLGYNFLGLSEHNILMQGERWVDVLHKKHPIPQSVIDKYTERFGKEWINIRKRGEKIEIRLKTLPEIEKALDEPGKFILIPNREITGKFNNQQVHVNALNIAELIQPQKGATLVDTLQRDIGAVQMQSARLRRPMLATVNHPGWPTYDISAWELAATKNARFVEFGNMNTDCNFYGDDNHPGMERVWDIANTIRISNMKLPPTYGTATDDTHRYHVIGSSASNPGKAWIMVRSPELSANAIVLAMLRGDFYASTGVTLKDVKYDPSQKMLTVEIDAEEGVKYTTEFIGTTDDYDRKSKTIEVGGKRPHQVRRYSSDIGRVLAKVEGPTATYKLTGRELFVRAAIRSDKPMENPVDNGIQNEEAWTQPVGWQGRIK